MSLAVARGLAELDEALAGAREEGLPMGFVPTMGALHAGHGSLVARAREECERVVVSIFINPLQFGPGEDLERYPRTLREDASFLESLGVDLLFLPSADEMYPPGFSTRVEQQGLTEVLCGQSRPGHFSGVLTVVLKLFHQVRPARAYFGLKDYQQFLVVRRMVRDLNLPVHVVGCPIVREADGLALSSRNRYLSARERSQALALREAFLKMDQAFLGGTRPVAELLRLGGARLARASLMRVDYLEIRDPQTLEERKDEARPGDLVALAAYLGSTRLIDNGLLGQDP